MFFIVEPSALHSGHVSVPGDKSISHRALMLGGVAHGETTVTGFLNGEDCHATLAALRALGVEIDERSPTELLIHGAGKQGLKAPAGALDLGNSGTGMRLFAGLLAGQAFSSRLVGDASLSRRPMTRVIEPLRAMGAEMTSSDGKPPLKIMGGQTLSGIDYRLPVASAQVKSALLLAGLNARGATVITEPAVTRDHTERMLQAMGADLQVEGSRIELPGMQSLSGTKIAVPADISSAAFIILAGLLASDCELLIANVGVNPTRTGALDILCSMGADIRQQNRRMFGHEPVADIVVRSSRLRGIEVDPTLVSLAIDEFPMLFVAAACASGSSTFSGIAELRVKESDRISVMAAGLRKLGIEITETADGAVVQGGSLHEGTVDSHGDHRVAMAFAVGGTVATGPIRIDDTDAVATSFPGFVACLRDIGGRIEGSALVTAT